MGRVPKYSYVILMVQAVAMIACIVLLILDEYLLYTYLFPPLLISYVIQLYRLRRARKQLDRDYIQILQTIAERQYQKSSIHEPQPRSNQTVAGLKTTDDALKDLREEIKRHKRSNQTVAGLKQ